ncbi:sugar ABC transporter permease [Desulfurococcaceae archaeon AG1]|nr:MAG: sugar ABC transporter permease [Desulfurococcaceae archaeon]GAY25132.1 sugar ABC transporter permease [Desulfurococcaceae archaeon AG1]
MKLLPFLLILPALTVLLFVTVYPIVSVLYYSLHSYNIITGEFRFTGLQEYLDLLQDPVFQISVRNTLIFSLAATFLQTFLGLSIAVIINQEIRGKRYLVPLIVLPNMFSAVIVSSMWKLMLEYDTGLVNHILRALGFQPLPWLTSIDLALLSIVIIDTWQWTPICFLILYAGLQSIPKELYEAALVDGAPPYRTFLHITLPLLKPYITLVLLLRSIDTFRLFDKVYVLTGGGPAHATETISLYIFKTGLVFWDIGKASAASFLMLILILAVSAFYIKKVMFE